MTLKSLGLAGAILGLAACGSGGGDAAFTDPIDAETMQKAIAKQFDGTCVERETNTFVCGSYGDEPVGSGGIPEIGFVMLEEGAEKPWLANLYLKHTYLEEDDTLNMLKRFGFSESDFREAIESGDFVERNGAMLRRVGSDQILIATPAMLKRHPLN